MIGIKYPFSKELYHHRIASYTGYSDCRSEEILTCWCTRSVFLLLFFIFYKIRLKGYSDDIVKTLMFISGSENKPGIIGQHYNWQNDLPNHLYFTRLLPRLPEICLCYRICRWERSIFAYKWLLHCHKYLPMKFYFPIPFGSINI